MDALVITNKFWNTECRDDELQRLKRQKHAAHNQVYRLRLKMREMEIARRLLIVAYMATSHANLVLHERIERYVKEVDEL